MKPSKNIQLPALVLGLLLFAPGWLYAQGTAFTYQGRLDSNGGPASGTYNLTFSLFTAGSGGSPVGGTVTTNGVIVTNGLFTVTIDFGSNAFIGETNWLQIGVESNGVTPFTTLTPRQQLTPVPYAVFATTASNVTGMVSAGQVSGPLASGGLSGTYSSAVTLSNAGNSFTGTFTGNGGGLTNLAAWQLAGNTGTAGSNFLGTTDNQPLQIRVGGAQAGLMTPSNGSPNIVFGPLQNVISNGTSGASILGGSNNMIAATSGYSVIGGGQQNTISNSADHSVLGGGSQNTIQAGAIDAFLGGGTLNTIQTYGIQSVLVGGSGNSIQTSSTLTFLGGGYENTIQVEANGAVLVGGGNNTIGNSDNEATLVGGYRNTIGSGAGMAFLGGGSGNNIANGAADVLVGGNANLVNGQFYGFLGGGSQNTLGNGQYSTLVGGLQNSIENAYYAFLGGGLQNTNSANNAFLGGGQSNVIGAIANDGFIGGGVQNSNNASYAFLGGGQSNVIIVNANSAFLGSGQNNTVSGNLATVPGGMSNLASAQFSFAAGDNAQAINSGAFVWSDAEGTPFASTNANSFNVRASGGVRLVTGGAGLSVDGSPVLAGNNGSGLVNLNASQLTSGTVPLAQLPSSVVTNNEPNVSLGALNLSGNVNLPIPVKFTSGNSLSPLLSLDNNDNVFFGFAGGASGGTQNTGIGFNALLFNQVGNYNTAIGVASLEANLSGSSNTANGENALSSFTSGNNNIGLGCNAGHNLTSGNNDIYIGNAGMASESGIIRIGTPGTQTQAYVAGDLFAGGGVTIGGVLTLPSPANIYSDAGSIYLDTNGNIALGLYVGGTGGGGVDNVALGDQALGLSSFDSGLVAIGYQALNLDRAGNNSFTVTGQGENTAVGYSALAQDSSGAGNTALGYNALLGNFDGNGNTAVGDDALPIDGDGTGNVAIGYSSLFLLGSDLIFENAPAYAQNTAVGYNALDGLVIGRGNIAIGAGAGSNNSSGNNNIYIGNEGVNGDNNIIYIGTAGTQVATYLAGNVYAEKGVYAANMQLISDRNMKENFQPVDNQAVLAKVSSLPMTEWNYKADNKSVQHIGPMAQDFQAAFGLDGADDKHISVVDEGGVALAAIQGLNQKLEADAKAKDAEIDALKQSVAELKQLVQSLASKK